MLRRCLKRCLLSQKSLVSHSQSALYLNTLLHEESIKILKSSNSKIDPGFLTKMTQEDKSAEKSLFCTLQNSSNLIDGLQGENKVQYLVYLAQLMIKQGFWNRIWEEVDHIIGEGLELKPEVIDSTLHFSASFLSAFFNPQYSNKVFGQLLKEFSFDFIISFMGTMFKNYLDSYRYRPLENPSQLVAVLNAHREAKLFLKIQKASFQVSRALLIAGSMPVTKKRYTTTSSKTIFLRWLNNSVTETTSN